MYYVVPWEECFKAELRAILPTSNGPSNAINNLLFKTLSELNINIIKFWYKYVIERILSINRDAKFGKVNKKRQIYIYEKFKNLDEHCHN